MRLTRLLADPWTIGAGAFVGALATVGLALSGPVGLAVGVGAYAVGTAVRAVTSRDEPETPSEPGVVLPPRGTQERALHDRAWAAVADLEEIASAQAAGPLRDATSSVHRQAREALDGIGRIAAQTLVLRQALARVDVAQAERDAVQLEQLQRLDGAGHEDSLAAVRSRLDVAARLDKAARAADSRLLSAALGLESLVASMAEVVAMASAGGDVDAGSRVRGLADELAGLRAGLAEAEETSRRALST